MKATDKIKTKARPMPLGKLKRVQVKRARAIPRTKLKRQVEKEAPPQMRQVLDLSFHPLLERVGLLPDLITREVAMGNAQGKGRAAHKERAEEMERDFRALVASIGKYGLRDKIRVIGNQIIDGRHRYEAVRELMGSAGTAAEGIDPAIVEGFVKNGIPVEEVQEADAVAVVMDGVNRRHLSKGARAYLAVLMRPAVATERKRGGDRRSNRTECGLIEESGGGDGLTADSVAAEAGVSLRLIEDAIAIYQDFGKRSDLRERFESSIWTGAGLAALRSGMAAYLLTGAEPDELRETDEQRQARLDEERTSHAMERWTMVTRSVQHFEKLSAERQRAIAERAAETVAELPEVIRTAIATAILAKQG